VPCEVRERRVSSTRNDLGPYGTEAQPRDIAFKARAGRLRVRGRPHEKYVLTHIPVSPQFQARDRGPRSGHEIEAFLILRWWYRDRQQFEDPLVYINRAADKYLAKRQQRARSFWPR
jgi:hypothetical protein